MFPNGGRTEKEMTLAVVGCGKFNFEAPVQLPSSKWREPAIYGHL